MIPEIKRQGAKFSYQLIWVPDEHYYDCLGRRIYEGSYGAHDECWFYLSEVKCRLYMQEDGHTNVAHVQEAMYETRHYMSESMWADEHGVMDMLDDDYEYYHAQYDEYFRQYYNSLDIPGFISGRYPVDWQERAWTRNAFPWRQAGLEYETKMWIEEMQKDVRKCYHACKIADAWLNAYWNPRYKVCKKRLLRDFQELNSYTSETLMCS